MLPMQKAKYRARAVGVKFGNSSNNNTQIAVTVEVVDHDEYTGEETTWVGHFTDKTTERTIESLRHMGWQGDDLSELEDADAVRCAELLPDAIVVVVEPEIYDGKERLKAQWINKIGGGFAFKEPLVGADLKSFAAQMRAQVKAVRPSTRPQSNGARSDAHPNAPGNGEDDGLPF